MPLTADLAPATPAPALRGRTPTCLGCGGSGYVYLWSVARDGNRTWYCDRHACKQWWSDNDSLGRRSLSPADNGVAEATPPEPAPVVAGVPPARVQPRPIRVLAAAHPTRG